MAWRNPVHNESYYDTAKSPFFVRLVQYESSLRLSIALPSYLLLTALSYLSSWPSRSECDVWTIKSEAEREEIIFVIVNSLHLGAESQFLIFAGWF